MGKAICASCHTEVRFPVRRGLRIFHVGCLPPEERPRSGWVPGAPERPAPDTRPAWVRRMQDNAKVLV